MMEPDSGSCREVEASSATRFERIAGQYDQANRILSFGLDRPWRAAAAELLAPQSGEELLDVCCGTGDLALAVAAREVHAHVTAVDLSEAMLSVARGKPASSAVSLVLGDALAMPFADHRFDGLTCGFGLRNLPERAAALREIRRVLRPGGRAIILEFVPPGAGIWGGLARLWIAHAVPALGRVIGGDAEAYRYLARSIAAFASPERLSRELAAAGFGAVTSKVLFPGVVALWRAEKPTA